MVITLNLVNYTYSRTKIFDISPLRNLTNLTYLYLDDNRITDISPLSGLTNLTRLSLGHNQITDIKPLLD